MGTDSSSSSSPALKPGSSLSLKNCSPSSTSASSGELPTQGPFTQARLLGNLPFSSQHLSSGPSRTQCEVLELRVEQVSISSWKVLPLRRGSGLPVKTP